MSKIKNIISADAIRARRDYQRAWRKKNPEKVKQYTTKYWETKAAAAKSENTEG